MGCGKALDCSYWNFCGESEFGSKPVLCINCGGDFKLKKEKENTEMNCESLLKYATPAWSNEELIQKQKQVADKVLDRLEIIDPSCIVAGGAPRDWTMGKPASDVDIFLSVSECNTMSTVLKQIQKALGSTGISEAAYNKLSEKIDCGINTDKVAQLYRTNPDILFVFNAEVDGVNCQIICVKVPTYQVVDKFPFGICKVWYKNGAIRTTKAFDLALALKVLVLTGTLYNNEDFYVKKIREKFSYEDGWKFYSSKEQFISTYL